MNLSSPFQPNPFQPMVPVPKAPEMFDYIATQ
jgi:hypothetical protein